MPGRCSKRPEAIRAQHAVPVRDLHLRPGDRLELGPDPGQKLAAAIIMGVAISGMHYTGMRAAICTAQATTEVAHEDGTLDRTPLALAIAGFVLADLAALFASASKRKRADEALRQTQADLAHIQRVAAMGELAASISHEVMQPIAATVNNAQAALRFLAGC